jgi:hypothetical protein
MFETRVADIEALAREQDLDVSDSPEFSGAAAQVRIDSRPR